MKKYALWILFAVLFCAVTYGGCGGGPDNNFLNTDSGESQPEKGSSDTAGGREGTSDTEEKIVELSTLRGEYIAQDGEILTGNTSGDIKIIIADGAVVTLRDANISSVKAYKRPGISCEGDAAINLEGSNYVRSFAVRYPAVHVPERKTLTIMGSGTLVAEGRTSAAAIGGGRGLSCGNINIRGGTITANGSAAGIGSAENSSCGDITITGGTVTAIGRNYGAGIGSDYGGYCGNITISGGTVEAVGGDLAGGIGGGGYGDCGNITITSGVTKVTATKGGKKIPYSIGAGNGGSCGVLTIGGVKTEYMYESPYMYAQVMDLSEVTADFRALEGQILTGTLGRDVKVSITDGAAVTLSDMTIDINGNSWAGINCLGNAELILEGSNTVQVYNQFYPAVHVPEEKTLTIKGSGSLTAKHLYKGAAIGGGYDNPCGNIVIEDGTVTASGGENSAAIGSVNDYCGNITITGGNVTASGGIHGAGIGTGYFGECEDILISGGTVSASGGAEAAGIGTGSIGFCGNITITDSVTKVTAVKGVNAPDSIGAGAEAQAIGTVTIGEDKGRVSKSPCIYEP